MSKAKAFLKWLGIGLAGFLAIAVAGLAAGYGWLQSDSGRAWLVSQIEAAASTPGEMELSIGALEGDLLDVWRLRDITMLDREGVWLEVAAVEVDWRPRQLLRRTLAIDALTLSEVALARLPAEQPEGAAEEESGDPRDLLDFPLKIRVGRLAADEVALGRPILGEAARFTLAGKAGQREDGTVSANLEVERLDVPEAQLHAALLYAPAEDRLTVEIEAAEAAGGLVATLLEMPELPRTELRLAGSGPLDGWDGDLTLTLGDVAAAQAAIALQRTGGELSFRLQGTATIEPATDSPAWRLLAGRTEIGLEGAWEEERQRLRLERLAAANESLSLEAGGTMEPASGALDLTVSAAAGDSPALAQLLELDRLGSASIELALTGSLAAPAVEIALRAEELARPDFTADALVAGGRLHARSDLLGPAPSLGFDLQGQLEAPRLPGQEDVNQLLGAQLSWATSGGVDAESGAIDIATLEISTAEMRLAATGQAQGNEGTAALDLTLEIADLAALGPLTGVRLAGPARLEGPLAVGEFGRRITAELEGRWEQPASEIALIAAVAGEGIDLAAQLSFDSGRLRVEQATARSAVAALQASLTVTPEAELRDGRYSLTLPDAAALAGALGVELAGRAQVEGEASGPFDALRVDGRARIERLSFEDQVLSDITGDYQLQLSGGDIDGPVSLAFASPFGPAEVRSAFSLREESVGFADLRAELPGATARGDVTVPLDGGEPVADLRADIADLAPWLQFAGLSGSGSGRIEARLHGSEQAAPVMASAEISGLTLRPQDDAAALSAGRLTVTLQAQDLALAEPGTIELGGDDLRWSNLHLVRVDATGRGTADDLALSLAGEGEWIEPFDLQADGRVMQEGETLIVALNEAQGRLFGQPLQLRQAARLTLAPAETRLEGLDVASGDARLSADAVVGTQEIAVTANLDSLPLSTADAFWDSGLAGQVSARLNLEGPAEDPRGTAQLTSSGLRPRGSDDVPALNLEANAEWRNGRLMVEGQLGGPAVTAARFNADAPLRFDAEAASLEVPPDAPLSGQLDWSGSITTLLLFVPMPQHRLAGDAAIELAVSGTLDAPRLDGGVRLDGARYENLETGTVLRDLHLTAEVAGDRVTLATLTANDGAGGRMSGSGGATIDPARQFPFDVTVDFDSFHALRRDDVTAVTSGRVNLAGTTDAPRVEVRLTTNTVEVSLLGNLPPNVVTLDVVEMRNGEVLETPEEDEAGPALDAMLDIVIEMPRRVFVRGRGLDSEWEGRITVQGSAADPVVSGAVNLVRGQLSVVGKQFDLRSGQVTLPESADVEPTVDVTAVYSGEQLEVTARMSGPLSQPELELTSVPEVPRDEIVSRVLFSKSAAELSAVEAAQLALALRDLTGRGGGTDVLGFARRTLGVDVLRIETAEGEAPAIEAGTYLSDRVYFGIRQGTSSQSSAAGVEVELTPNITLESEMTTSGANKSGVRFRWDY